MGLRLIKKANLRSCAKHGRIFVFLSQNITGLASSVTSVFLRHQLASYICLFYSCIKPPPFILYPSSCLINLRSNLDVNTRHFPQVVCSLRLPSSQRLETSLFGVCKQVLQDYILVWGVTLRVNVLFSENRKIVLHPYLILPDRAKS